MYATAWSGGNRVAPFADLLQRRTADVLHDDVAHRGTCLVGMLDEVDDPNDVLVVDLGKSLGFGSATAIASASRCHQTLEHDPAVVHVAVARQVDPAESAVRDATLNLVLAAHKVAARKLRSERESVPHWVQKPRASRAAVASATDGRVASWFPQSRWSSGTCGSVKIAAAGSPFGTGGIATTPAPRRPRPLPDFGNPIWAARPTRAVELSGALRSPHVAG